MLDGHIKCQYTMHGGIKHGIAYFEVLFGSRSNGKYIAGGGTTAYHSAYLIPSADGIGAVFEYNPLLSGKTKSKCNADRGRALFTEAGGRNYRFS